VMNGQAAGYQDSGDDYGDDELDGIHYLTVVSQSSWKGIEGKR
jgi:hypothetical protein